MVRIRSIFSVRLGWPIPPYWTCKGGLFWVGLIFFFGFGWVFDLIEFWVKIHESHLTRELLQVKNYGSYPLVTMIKWGPGFFRIGRIRLVGGRWYMFRALAGHHHHSSVRSGSGRRSALVRF
jgi:hypothetical protein